MFFLGATFICVTAPPNLELLHTVLRSPTPVQCVEGETPGCAYLWLAPSLLVAGVGLEAVFSIFFPVIIIAYFQGTV